MIDRNRATITLTLEEFDSLQRQIEFLKTFNYTFIDPHNVKFEVRWEDMDYNIFRDLLALRDFFEDGQEKQWEGWIHWNNKKYWFEDGRVDFSKTIRIKEENCPNLDFNKI